MKTLNLPFANGCHYLQLKLCLLFLLFCSQVITAQECANENGTYASGVAGVIQIGNKTQAPGIELIRGSASYFDKNGATDDGTGFLRISPTLGDKSAVKISIDTLTTILRYANENTITIAFDSKGCCFGSKLPTISISHPLIPEDKLTSNGVMHENVWESKLRTFELPDNLTQNQVKEVMSGTIQVEVESSDDTAVLDIDNVCVTGTYTTLKVNRVLSMSGRAARLRASSPVTGNDDFTAELWFTGSNGSNPRIPLLSWGSFANGNLDRFHILSENDQLRILDDNFNNGFFNIVPFTKTIDDDGEWHHIAITKAGSTVTVYLDDEDPYTYQTAIANSFNLATSFTLGKAFNDLRNSWIGQLDELRIWSVARTAAEIEESRSCKLSGSESGLALYYDFDNTINSGGQEVIPDRTVQGNNGFMSSFSSVGAANLLLVDMGVTFPCAAVPGDCEITFTTEREDCSNSFTFTSDEKDPRYSYFWEISRDTPTVYDTYTTEDIDYTFDFRQVLGVTTNHEVCLTVTFDDGCEARYCETIEQPDSDANYYSITNTISDVSLTADEETCTATSDAQFLRLTTCPGSLIRQQHIRSDGKAMDEPYEIGTTTVTVNVGNPRGIGVGGFAILESFTYEVTVDEVESCCMDEMELSSSLIPNPGFEEVSCEPTTFGALSCAEVWVQATTATSDLYGPEFNGSSSQIGPLSNPPNDSEHWVGAIYTSPGYVEYVGACLLEPIIGGIEYTFQAYMGTGVQNNFGGSYQGDFVILGIPECTLPISGFDCKEDEFEVIGRVSLNIPAGVWLEDRVAISVMADQDYKAIIFGPSCDPEPAFNQNSGNYLLVDDLIVMEGTPCDEDDTDPEPSDCFTIESSEIICNDDLTYDISIQIKNENDQVFDRLLTFAQTNGTAINPTIAIEFGDGESTLQPGEVSGDIEFTIRQREYVDEEIEVCFDVIPQNPELGDCCKDDFCLTLPVCCEPKESKDNGITLLDSGQDCCYEVAVSNVCSENYYLGLLLSTTNPTINLENPSTVNDWNYSSNSNGSIAFYYENGVTDVSEDYVPLYSEQTTIGTVCVDGVTAATEMEQAMTIDWIAEGENGNFVVCTDTLPTACPSDPCNLVFNPAVTCDDLGEYFLEFTLQVSPSETEVTTQIVINPLGTTQVSHFTTQSFDNLMMPPGSALSFIVGLNEVSPGQTIDFQVTLHNFNSPLPDGSYWCCYDGQEVSVTIPPCGIISNPGESGEPLDPGVILEPYIGPVERRPSRISYVVYPNPVHEIFTLAFEQETETPLDLELINMQGELITNRTIAEGTQKYSLSMQGATPAIYFIRLKNENGTIGYRKILKL